MVVGVAPGALAAVVEGEVVEGAEEAAVALVEGDVVEGVVVVVAQEDLGDLEASNGDLIMKFKQATNHDSKLKLYKDLSYFYNG